MQIKCWIVGESVATTWASSVCPASSTIIILGRKPYASETPLVLIHYSGSVRNHANLDQWSHFGCPGRGACKDLAAGQQGKSILFKEDEAVRQG